MDIRAALAYMIIQVMYLQGALGKEQCYSPQFAEVGRTATIQCAFQTDFFAVAWFNSTETVLEKPLIHFQQSVKSGRGFSSGMFDIHNNGSLIIKNVSAENDHVFAVTKLETPFSDFIPYYIRVVVIVRPLQDFPLIDGCGKDRNVCLQKLPSQQTIRCTVTESRPPVNLSWVIRNDDGDLALPNEFTFHGPKSDLYNTSVVTYNTFKQEMVICLFVCKELGPPFLLLYKESFILLQSVNVHLSTQTTTEHFEVNSSLELTCSDQDILFLVWEKYNPLENSLESLLYAVLLGNGFKEIYNKDFMLGARGSLLVPRLGFQHEGIYECSFGNGNTGGKKSIDVQIFAFPTPRYLLIDGCDHGRYCVLEVSSKGNLTCSVKGVRPKVTIQFETLQESSPNELLVSKEKITFSSRGDAFDIVLNAHYEVGHRYQNRLTMKCSVTGTNIPELRLSTTFDLLFLDDPVHEANLFQLPSVIIVVTVVGLLVTGLVVLIAVCLRRRIGRTNLRKTEQEPNELEIASLLGKEKGSGPGAFLQELEITYTRLCNGVRPIPLVRERQYSVKRVFVEGGLQWYKPQGGSNEWVRFSSYKDIFEDAEYTTIILEGDPGYGKSTLALQIVYDWCKKVKPMDAVDLLIFLQLRQLEDVPSIYRAIRQFILPKDSLFSEDNINQFLKASSSLVILFDGYDEYPDRENGKQSDVLNIIAKKMLQKATVILTTRPISFSEKYSPQTKRMRLTGFDTEARNEYIFTAVAGNNKKTAENIKKQIYKNPVVKAILEVPLFFVIFAHILQENSVRLRFNSVTSFFKFLIRNIHSHEHNKNRGKREKSAWSDCDKRKLTEIAFRSLQSTEKKIVWKKDDLRREIGNSLYEQYVRTGILVEEDVLLFENTTNDLEQQNISYQTQVRFYHQLFCEWYAAHFLASRTANGEECLESLLENIDPDDMHFFYRFTCGLTCSQNVEVGQKIIKHLNKLKKGTLAILCMVELDDDIGKVKDTIRRVCNATTFYTKDSRFLQMSTIQLLEIASTSQIDIAFFELYGCFKAMDRREGKMVLKSGLFLPYLPTLNELWISDEGREFTTSEVDDILFYASNCGKLKTIVFFRCLLPFSGLRVLPTVLIKRGVRVSWQPGVGSLYKMDLEFWKWQIDSKQEDLSATGELNYTEYAKTVEVFRKKWSDSEFQQCLQEKLLKIDVHRLSDNDGDFETLEL